MKILGTLSPDFEKHFYTAMAVIAVLGIAAAVGFGIACRAIVRGKGYPDEMNHGFLWGFFLGFIGLIVCAVKPPYGLPPAGGYQTYYYNGQPMNGQPPYGQPYDPNRPYGGQQGQAYYGQPPYPQQPPAGWQCSCGAVNPPNTNFCGICGSPRR